MAMRRTGSNCRRRSSLAVRALAIVVTASLVAQTQIARVAAQEGQPLTCGVNGFCLSPNLTNLLGLPNGTLKIRTYQPWDRVVKGSAASAWEPLEAEARMMLAALHGVPNDYRLPHAALNEIRAVIVMRLIAIAKAKAEGRPLTDIEATALDTLARLVVQHRVRGAELALAEYARWQAHPCGYTVPTGFGFVEYDAGPGCNLPRADLSGPPRPPTREQFTAYGFALANREMTDAIRLVKAGALGVPADDPSFVYDPWVDQIAAMREAEYALRIGVGVAAGIAAGTIAAAAAAVSGPVGVAFATIAGSFSIWGSFPTAVGAALGAVTGIGIAGSLPTIIVIAAAVAVIFTIQFAEDQSVLPALQSQLEQARVVPDIWALANDGSTDDLFSRLELFMAVLNQTLPSYDAERVANVAPAPPAQRGPGEPRFDVNGALADVLETVDPEGRPQQTFMSQGWFITRAQAADGAWTPWRWSLVLHYRGGNLSDRGTHTAGIRPAGFFHVYQDAARQVQPAAPIPSLFVLTAAGQSQTVTWAGNRRPVLAPTVSEAPEESARPWFSGPAPPIRTATRSSPRAGSSKIPPSSRCVPTSGSAVSTRLDASIRSRGSRTPAPGGPSTTPAAAPFMSTHTRAFTPCGSKWRTAKAASRRSRSTWRSTTSRRRSRCIHRSSPCHRRCRPSATART